MADLLNFKITPLGQTNVNVHRATIEALIVDSNDQSKVLSDFTGPNALMFPAVISTLTAADRVEFAQLVANWLLMRKAGLG